MNIPNPLDNIPNRLVRRVVATASPAAEAIFTLAAGSRRGWNITDWAALLKELDNSEETVLEFRALRELEEHHR